MTGMATDAIDDELARTLGAAVAAHSHEDLPAGRVKELGELTTVVEKALETDSHAEGAALLLEFWTGHVARELDFESPPEAPDAAADVVEDGFEAGALGVDLYQALSKVATARERSTSTPELDGWTERLFELTNRHVGHLESHQHDS